MDESSFGIWLKQKRKNLGWTQEQIALQVNCSLSTLRKIEADKRRPSVQMVESFAKIFKIPAGEQATFLKFARGAWQSDSENHEESPWLSTSSHRSNLPTPVTSLIGREQEIAEICEYLLKADVRLVTLIGPPGIGKTRLSLESAHTSFSKFPDGVFFVPLAPLNDPALIAPAIIQSLGYAEIKNESALEQIIDGISDKQMLLVLDNFEHLVDDAAPLVSGLLSACSRLKVMVTSRESLRVSGEWLYSVPTLRIPLENTAVGMDAAPEFSALTLFAERARAVRSDFTLNSENIQIVSSICTKLDGLPLAIELVATRIRLMSPQLLLERMNDQFVLSANGMRPESARQKTLGNAIGWSYHSLPPDEQKLFACLSVFSGSFSLQAAEKIFAKNFTNKPVTDLLTLLLDKSLLQRMYDTDGEIRFTMLVTIQKFALDRLRQSEGENEARDQHLAYFLDLAEQADQEVHGPDQIKWMDRLTHELDNFRTALNWCVSSEKTRGCLQLLNALSWTSNVRWSRSEELGWFNKIQSMKDVDKYPADYARMLNNIGLREWRRGDYDKARSTLEKSLAIWLKLNTGNDAENDLGKAEALNRLGMVARWGEADVNKAESYFNQSLALFQRQEDDWGVAWNLFHLGIVADDRNQDDVALSLLEQSMDLYNELGDPWAAARVSQFLGMLYLKQRRYEKASFHFDQHLRNDERLRFMDGVSVALTNFGDLHRLQGDYDKAEQYYTKSLAVSLEYGLKLEVSFNIYNLGLLALHQNDFSKALQYFTDYFESARTIDKKTAAHILFIGLASIFSETDQPERAAKLFGAAQEVENLFSSFDRDEFQRRAQIVRGQLGNDRFESLRDEGRRMDIEDAVVYALENQSN